MQDCDAMVDDLSSQVQVLGIDTLAKVGGGGGSPYPSAPVVQSGDVLASMGVVTHNYVADHGWVGPAIEVLHM